MESLLSVYILHHIYRSKIFMFSRDILQTESKLPEPIPNSVHRSLRLLNYVTERIGQQSGDFRLALLA